MLGAEEWEQYDVEDKIRAILETAQPDPKHSHLDRPFLSSYQLAIEFRANHKSLFIGLQTGGKDIGEHNSLAQALGGELASRIRKGSITDIEMVKFSHRYLKTLKFKDGDNEICSSLAGKDLTLFRLRD